MQLVIRLTLLVLAGIVGYMLGGAFVDDSVSGAIGAVLGTGIPLTFDAVEEYKYSKRRGSRPNRS